MIDQFKDDFRFLSNFFDSPFTHNGIVFPTNEHFYQAMKTLNIATRKKIAALDSPEKAKKYGRTLVLRLGWEENKIRVMRKGLELKFITGSLLAEMLLATFPEELFEGNYWGDTFWGVDLKNNNVGENWLGKLLMERRDWLLNKKTEEGKHE